ncbi:hypothetical protein OF83DRAFT_1160366 [Amylostereum chailletii]|nr:hypothetical protein OF83DRAFT_1160366 [Amylostereum chailletii]
MRTEMNTLLPISLLPIEVLCKIFAIAAAIDPMIVSTLRYYPLSARRKIGWIKVSHVCRSWREAALGCPTLWTNVPLHGGAFWRNAFLARSRAAAIDVTAPKVDREWYSVSTILSEHLHRVRKLSASIQNQNDLGFLSSPAPLLEHSDIDCFNNGSLFSGHAPRLTSVSISQPPAFPVHPTLYANVYKFAINRDISDRDTFLIPSSMSRITDLQLNGCLPAVPGPPWPEHTLHLPHLSHLELKGPIAHVSGVLDQVRLSQLCTLRVVCEMANDNMMDVHDVPPFLRALPREAFVVRALSVSSHAQDCLEVNAWPTPHCVDENSLFSLSFQWPEGQSGSHSVVGKLVCQSVPLDELEVLAVHSLLLGWTPEIWKTIFDRLSPKVIRTRSSSRPFPASPPSTSTSTHP